MTAYDLSAPFRQGILLAPGNPRQFVKSFGVMMRSAFKEEYYIKHFTEMKVHPRFKLYEKAGLSYTGPGTAALKGEEAYMQHFTRKIPGLGLSERAYTSFLNDLRFGVMDNVYTGWRKGGGLPGLKSLPAKLESDWFKMGGEAAVAVVVGLAVGLGVAEAVAAVVAVGGASVTGGAAGVDVHAAMSIVRTMVVASTAVTTDSIER